ncbi:Crp/Fnr family transcriptional regulator [Candidatus Magnetomonas plexicatena]|uniref:Crp/Fnr family transcriptional regulator n=1 Tax=Candidatus Magnetomonas plexicatena TaxID=2552947 RepID=UPI001C74E4A1|nr:cyclic nucleotide-binding domain-containing protein [Nitrospirales bacterium LBB_01]
MTPRLEDLKNQVLFESLDDSELQVVLGMLKVVEFSKGAFIFQENDPTKGIYLIHSGKIEIKRKLQLDTKSKMLVMLRNIKSDEIRHTAHGWENRFAVLEKGSFFGELSVIESRRKHSAECAAMEDTVLLLLPSEEYLKLEETHVYTVVKILKSIAKVTSGNVRQLDRRILKALMGT